MLGVDELQIFFIFYKKNTTKSFIVKYKKTRITKQDRNLHYQDIELLRRV